MALLTSTSAPRFADRMAAIVSAVSGHDLAWFGTRATDSEPLWRMVRSGRVFSLIAPLPESSAEGVDQDCLETRSGRRVDLDAYDIDIDPREDARGLKARLLFETAGRGIVVAYRPAEFLAAIGFCNPQAIMAFNFHLFQRQLEHKPWADKLLRSMDPSLPLLPTSHVHDTDIDRIRHLLADGPLVGRTTTSAGGAGVFLIANEADLIEHMPPHRDGFLTVSPFFEDGLPLNMNACIYEDGQVRAFGASFQLIGIKDLTPRRFGFCGNDFAAAIALPVEDLDLVQSITERVGACMARLGYRGVFGVDLLRHDGGICVLEVNPRFQASTALSSRICQQIGIPDPTTEHVAAFLGMEPPPFLSVAEQARLTGALLGSTPLAQVFHRNLLGQSIRLAAGPRCPPGINVDSLPGRSIWVERGAMICRSLHCDTVTGDGYSVPDSVSTLLRGATLSGDDSGEKGRTASLPTCN